VPTWIRYPAKWGSVGSSTLAGSLHPPSCQTFRMIPGGRVGTRRGVGIVVIAGGALAILSASAAAFLVQLTRIPLGHGTATITWTGATGITPTINSIRGTAGGFHVLASGIVPTSTGVVPTNATASTQQTVPSKVPVADVKGTIGGGHFTLNIVIMLPSELSAKPQKFGYVTGTFRNQQVNATLTVNLKSITYGFKGTIGSLHVTGVVSEPVQHGDTETAHATFDVRR